MKLKRIISTLLSAALLAGLLVCPASAAGVSGFTDISDPATAEAAEILRALGIVDGTGDGSFQPNRSLTRAEFCKMTIEMLGRGDEAASQSGRVIFSDVRGDHWARGYVNAAASKPSENEAPLVSGVGNGLFLPDDPITYGGAVAILMRALGYSDQDVGMGLRWYDGYLNTASAIGLTDGVSLSGEASVTRGQAAILFYNLLFTKTRGSQDPYLTKLGGSILDSALILSVDATADDGSSGAIKTLSGIYKTDRSPFAASYAGTWGKLVLDKNKRVLAIQTDDVGSDRSIIALDVQATYIKSLDGERLDIENPNGTPVYSASDDMVNYIDLWTNLRSGTQLTFHYSSSGKLEYIYRRGVGSETGANASMVARNFSPGSNPFLSLVKGTSYSIYKNGVPATVNDIRPYDVATYDSASGVLQISDLKLTGIFQNASPNMTTPTSVTIMNQDFPTLSSAAADLAQFKLGDTVTFLLTADGKVAGAIPTSESRSTVIGVVQPESSPGHVVVQSVNLQGYQFEGETILTEKEVEQLKGHLVTVSTGYGGILYVSRLSSQNSTGAWNVLEGTVGNAELAANVRIFEKVSNSRIAAVELADVTCGTVPDSKILYAGKDYAGKVNLLILDDVTGDRYTYGFLTSGEQATGTSVDGNTIYNKSVTVESSNGRTTLIGSTEDTLRNVAGGAVASLDTVGGTQKLAGSVLLTAIKEVPRSAFLTENDRTTVTIKGSVYPVSSSVVCYNKATGTWFKNLEEARAFSDSLTLYYDKAPSEGGKIRLVVAEN